MKNLFNRVHRLLWACTLVSICVAAGCEGGDESGTVVSDSPEDLNTETGSPVLQASCAYISAVSGREECKEYTGPGWAMVSAEMDCLALLQSCR